VAFFKVTKNDRFNEIKKTVNMCYPTTRNIHSSRSCKHTQLCKNLMSASNETTCSTSSCICPRV